MSRNLRDAHTEREYKIPNTGHSHGSQRQHIQTNHVCNRKSTIHQTETETRTSSKTTPKQLQQESRNHLRRRKRSEDHQRNRPQNYRRIW